MDTITWTRGAAGIYQAVGTGLFTLLKTSIIIGNNSSDGHSLFGTQNLTVDDFYLNSYNIGGVNTDGLLLRTAIKIEVYP